MAILEKEVWVNLHPRNIEHYEEKGYKIPKYYDKPKKVYRVKRGTKILVKVDDVQKRSCVKVTKVCDDCGNHIYNQPLQLITRTRELYGVDNKDRCFDCGKRKGGSNKKINVKYDRTLEYYATKNNKKHLLNEFSDRNIKKPNHISYGTDDKYWWNCPDCKSEYDMSVCNRTSGNSNCPYCAGYRVNHTNCLWTTHPHVAELLVNKERGYEITFGSRKKEYFKCLNCGIADEKSVDKVVKEGFRCRKCSDGLSYPEKFMFNFLEQLKQNYYITQLSTANFEWCKEYRYDFYIPVSNCIVETHGLQHYVERCGYWESLLETQENDRLKEKLARDNGIEHYIIIDCRRSELEWIKYSIMNSELPEILNFTEEDIDWLKCHQFSCSSLVKTVCDMWEGGMRSTNVIGEKVKLNYNTVRKYLKQGVKLGWCDYDPKAEMKKVAGKNGKKAIKAIVQLSIDNTYINEWEGAREANRNTGVGYNGISQVLRGKTKSSGGYKWMYKEDYEEYIKQANIS